MEKKSRFKKLLATTSALAILAAGAHNASAAPVTVQAGAGAVALVQGTNSAGALDAALTNADWLILAQPRDLTSAAALTLAGIAIDATANTGQTFTQSVAALTLPAGAGNAGTDIKNIALNIGAGGSVVNLKDTNKAVTVVDNGSLAMNDLTGVGADGKLTVTGANGGAVAVRNVGGDASITDRVANVTGDVTGIASALGAGLFAGDAVNTTVGSAVINTTAVGQNTLHTVTGALTMTDGNLTAHTVTGATTFGVANNPVLTIATGGVITGAVTTGAAGNGEIHFADTATVNGKIGANAAALKSVVVNKGAVSFTKDVHGNLAVSSTGSATATGVVGGTLNVTGTGLFVGTAGATNVTGAVLINTANTGLNRINNSTAAVTVNNGRLTMNDVGTDLTVGAAGDAVNVNSVGNNLAVAGGVTTVATTVGNNVAVTGGAATVTTNVTKDAAVSAGTLKVDGTVGGDLNVTGTGQFIGNAAATDVTGNVTIDTAVVDAAVPPAPKPNTVRDIDGTLAMTNGILNVHDVTGATTFGAANNPKLMIAAGGELKAAVTTGAANNGELHFAAGGKLKAVGAAAGGLSLNNITIGAGAVQTGGDIYAKNVILSDALAVLNVADTNNITGNVTAKTNNTGKLVVAANSKVTGSIGSKDAVTGVVTALNTVEVTGDAGAGKGLELTNPAATSHYATQFLMKDVGATITLSDNHTLVGNVVPNAANDGVISFNANGEIKGVLGTAAGKVYLGAVQAVGIGTVKINKGDHYVTDLALAVDGSIFKFADGTNIFGALGITTLVNTKGEAIFDGSGRVDGAVGKAGDSLAKVTLNGAAGSNVAFGSGIAATDIVSVNGGDLELDDVAGDIVGKLDFSAHGGKLKISGDAGHKVGAIAVSKPATAAGVTTETSEVHITNTVGTAGARTIEFNGKIGDYTDAKGAKALHLLSVDANAANAVTVEMKGTDSDITKIDLHTNAVTLDFTGAGSKHRIGGITSTNVAGVVSTNKATVKISGDTTFIAPADAKATAEFGTTNNPLLMLNLVNGKTLVVEDNVNIYATGVQGFVAAGDGTITFTGDSIFSAATTVGKGIKAINVNGANSTVKLEKNTEVTGDVTIADTATLEIKGDLKAAYLTGKTAAGTGTARFTNTAATTVTGAVGNAGVNSLKVIEFAGGDVTFAGKVSHAATNTFVFSGATPKTVTFTGATTDIGSNYFVNTDASGAIQTTVLGATRVFNDAKLAENGNQINFELADGINASLTGATVATGANFTTNADGKGKLTLNTTNAGLINSAGIKGKGLKLEAIHFTNDAGITNGAAATTIDVDAGQVATLGGTVTSTEAKLKGVGSEFKFLEDAIVNAPITAGAIDEGKVTFVGDAALNKDIGAAAKRVLSVTFANVAGKTATLKTDNIFAKNISMLAGEVKLAKDIILTSDAIAATGSNITLNDKKMTVAAGVLTFTGTNNITLTATSTGGNNITVGSIDAQTGLEYTAGSKIIINIDAASLKTMEAGKVKSYHVITSAVDPVTGKLDLSMITTPTSSDEFILATPVLAAHGGIDVLAKSNVAAALGNIMTNASADDKANFAAFEAAPLGTDGNNFAVLVTGLKASGTDGADKVKEAYTRVKPLNNAATAITAAAGSVTSNISQRMNSLAVSQGTFATKSYASNATSGISAGDYGARYGVWATPFFGKTKQKSYKGADAYNSDTVGSSFGFDTKANDDMTIGAAFTVASNTMKVKSGKVGDKTKVNSLMLSLYGMQQLTDNWFGQAVATIGTNEVKNTEKRPTLAGSENISGKYTSMSFNGEVLAGYSAVVSDQAIVTPMLGLRYSRVNSTGYTETGSVNTNNNVNTKATNKLEAIVGLRVAGNAFTATGMTITPEVHGFFNYDMLGNKSKQSVSMSGVNNLRVTQVKPVRSTFNVGAGLVAEYGMMEYGVGYDAEIAAKRVGHQGTLKVRVNF